MEPEALVRTLRSLRRGRGLTLGRLKATPLLLEALETSDVGVAMEILLDAIDKLGADVQAQALRNAYALGMTDPQNLTTRRRTFAAKNNRDPDTIESYENKMIDELAARIGSKPPEEDTTLTIAAVYKNETFDSLWTRLDPDLETAGRLLRQNEGFQSLMVTTEQVGPSAPALIYEHRLASATKELRYIVLGAMFHEGPLPTEAWAAHTADLWHLVIGLPRTNIDIVEQQIILGVFRVAPTVRYYGIFWRY